MRGCGGPLKSIGCLRCLLIVFLPPLAVIDRGLIPILIVTLCTFLGFWVLGSIMAAIYLGD